MIQAAMDSRASSINVEHYFVLSLYLSPGCRFHYLPRQARLILLSLEGAHCCHLEQLLCKQQDSCQLRDLAQVSFYFRHCPKLRRTREVLAAAMPQETRTTTRINHEEGHESMLLPVIYTPWDLKIMLFRFVVDTHI